MAAPSSHIPLRAKIFRAIESTLRKQRGKAATKGVGYRESTYEHASHEFYDADVTFTMKSMKDTKG